MKNLKEGMLVRIRRHKWRSDQGELGTLVRRTYLAYEEKHSKWIVHTKSGLKEVSGGNIYEAK